MQVLNQAALDFGGSNTYSGVSTSRTLMLKELQQLLASTPDDATIDDYKQAIVDDNVLLKPSVGTRSKTFSYLRDRYALDPAVPIFRLLRMLWDRDKDGQPLLALMVAILRDPVLRSTVPALLDRQPDQAIPSREFSRIIEEAFPGRLTEKTLKSTGENTTSSYKQSRHLVGRTDCRRQRVQPTAGSTTIALLLATLDGSGGYALLESDWLRLLDGSREQILSEARAASGRGWLELRHAGDVLEISFHRLLASIGVEV